MVMQLHRDQEVGVISGELEKEGFYGTEIQLHGFVYIAKGSDKQRVFISRDEMKVAVTVYNYYLQGHCVSNIVSRSKRYYGDDETINNESKKYEEWFEEMLLSSNRKERLICQDDSSIDKKIITEEENAHCFSGFVLKDGQRVKVVTNAYFPQTVKWWLEKKIKSYELGDIVVKRRNNSESPVIQMKRFKEELMQQKII